VAPDRNSASDQHFDEEWQKIVSSMEGEFASAEAEFAQRPSASEELPVQPPQPADESAGTRVAGPRDWSPPAEDDAGPYDPDTSIDPDTIDPSLLEPLRPAPPHNAYLLWLIPAVLVGYALLSGLNIVPGGGWMVGICLIAAIGATATILFAFTPHRDDTDPSDDGARI
jgi:hypothetical protein